MGMVWIPPPPPPAHLEAHGGHAVRRQSAPLGLHLGAVCVGAGGKGVGRRLLLLLSARCRPRSEGPLEAGCTRNLEKNRLLVPTLESRAIRRGGAERAAPLRRDRREGLQAGGQAGKAPARTAGYGSRLTEGTQTAPKPVAGLVP
jgi:hypothetical protein